MDSLIGRLADSLSHNPAQDAPDNYDEWLRYFFPNYVKYKFAEHHKQIWEWIWTIESGSRPRPLVAILPRGAGKSTIAELAIVSLAAMNRRKYFLYVRSTQELADKSVDNIASMLESSIFASSYPDASSKQVGKYGQSKGWRRNRLRTANGVTIDAYGLDVALRGTKVEEMRPDMIIFDDIDEKDDTLATTNKKIQTITKSILPAGSWDVAVLCIQNLIISNGFFARMANGTADYLFNRQLIGPVPAIQDLTYDEVFDEESNMTYYKITSGVPTWEGQSIEICEDLMNAWGDLAFLAEAQHDVDTVRNGTYADVVFRRTSKENLPPLKRIGVWVDPAVSDTDDSDAMGIQVGGRDAKGTVYMLYSWEDRASPKKAIQLAIQKALEYNAQEVGFETDQGGVLWRDMYYSVWDEMVRTGEIPDNTLRPGFKAARAGSIGSKRHRHNMMRAAYDKGEIVHVLGTHAALENGLKRFPINKPFDLADAAFWCWRSLRSGGGWSRGSAQA